MQVAEIMHKGVSTVQIGDSIKKVAALMKKEDIGAVPVFKNERPVGFVTDRDIVISCLATGNYDSNISQAMNNEIFSVHEHDDLSAALKVMREKQISRLLVLDQGERPVGMVSLHDISRNLKDEDALYSVISEIKR